MAAHRMVWHKGLQRCAQLTRKLGLGSVGTEKCPRPNDSLLFRRDFQ